jgi:hypothetical protein
MLQKNASKELTLSIRHLLVAADQICPTIIGKAHVLFALAEEQLPFTAEEIVREVKREAEELLHAVVQLETAAKVARNGGSVVSE